MHRSTGSDPTFGIGTPFAAAVGVLCWVFLLVLLIPCVAEPKKDEPSNEWRTCAKAEGEEAIAACTALITSGRYQGRNLAILYINRGSILHSKGNYDRALEDYSQAIELDPKYALAFVNRGIVYGNMGDFDRAIENYDRAIELDPKSVYAFINRCDAYQGKKSYDRAIKDCHQAAQMAPDNAVVFMSRGTAYRLLKQYDQAIQDFDRAIVLDPNNAYAFLNRGDSYSEKELHDRAIQDYQEALRHLPKSYAFLSLNNLCFEHAVIGDVNQALPECDKALKLYPDSAEILDTRGFVYLKMGDFDSAIADYNAALRLEPKKATSLYGRGKAKLGKGDSTGGATAILRQRKLSSQMLPMISCARA